MELVSQIDDLKTSIKKLDIVQMFSSMEHPQTNRIAETTNKIIIIGLKKKLEQAKGL